MEYTYTIDLPDNWSEVGNGRYSSDSPWARLRITSTRLPPEFDVEHFGQLVQEGLRGEWWSSSSLFEVSAVEKVEVGSQAGIRIRYRVQEEPRYCVVDVEELVLVFQTLPGFPQGFRMIAWTCEHDVTEHQPVRDSLFESFRVTTRPAEYYTQFVPVKGVLVKAHESVDPAALKAGVEIVDAMLSGREDIAQCMPLQGADLAVIPRDKTNVDLPEFAHLAGTTDFTGRRRDTFEIRGLGGVRGQPVSSAAEEQLLGNPGPEHPWYPYLGLVATHEYAHAVQNLCFTEEDHEKWNGFYQDAVKDDLYPGSHMMADVMEFFAVFSTGYFEVTWELGDDSNREQIAERFPEVFKALDEIYDGATLPEKFRTLQRRP